MRRARSRVCRCGRWRSAIRRSCGSWGIRSWKPTIPFAPWLDKVADWIEAGKTPHVYLHTPDNHRAPELAMRFHQLLSERLPGMPALAAVREAPQLSLLD